jgi:uncharacterized protein YjiS (DUF1127 family)
MIIMEAILSASALLHGRGAQSVGRSVVRTFKRWRAAYTAWHKERRAMAELLSMSDRDLRDIASTVVKSCARFAATQRVPCRTQCRSRSQYRGRAREGSHKL